MTDSHAGLGDEPMTDAEIAQVVDKLRAGPSMTSVQAAIAIDQLRARVAELERERNTNV